VFVELNKKSLVVQSNKLIEARYRLSVEEQKVNIRLTHPKQFAN